MKKLIIIGAGGHGKVIADIALKLNTFDSIAFLDDGDKKECMGLKVIGKVSDKLKYVNSAEIFVAIGNSEQRKKLIEELLEAGASVPVLIHPSAVIGNDVAIGQGTAIMAGAVINPCSKLGKGVILNTCSSIDHDCVVEDFCHLAVGVRLAGTVTLGTNVWLGVASAVKNNVSICANTVIGAGAVVVDNIVESGTYVGVPAKILR
jgi:sugar O-acyltransferase (sialic acid O-acetyltransferase NeuD family)